MEFTFITDYTAKSLAVMAKGLRKTLRSRKNRRTTILGLAVVALATLLVIPAPGESFRFTAGNIVTLTAAAVLVFTLVFQDRINGYVAYRRMVHGLYRSRCTFGEENFKSETAIGSSVFYYSTIKAVAENKAYFVFVIDNNHGQLYYKPGITGGTAEEFARFISGKTGLKITKF